MSAPSLNAQIELLDSDDLSDEEIEQLATTACPVDGCTARRRNRVGKSKYSPGRLEYPEECGLKSGGFHGLIHRARRDAMIP